MALTQPTIQSALMATRSAGSHPFMGAQYDRLVLALSTALATWGVGNPANLALTGTATGTSGVGAVVPAMTRVVVPPNVGVLLGALQGASLRGPLGTALATSVALGISQAFATAGQYSGPSPTVGTGADVAKVTTVNEGALVAVLQGTLSGLMGAGPMSQSLALGLAKGITMMLLQGTGFGTVVGSPTVPPTPLVGVTPRSVVV